MSAREPDAAADLEITPEMIEAGRKVLWDSGLELEGAEGCLAEIEVMRAIYRVMTESRPR